MKFKVGDVVRLKGQTVKMTVTGVSKTDKSIEVVWFVRDELQRAVVMHQQALEKVPGENPSKPSAGHAIQ